ncbi:MAG: TOBE domain-containing protein, partial [Acetobacteraceae bacterium]
AFFESDTDPPKPVGARVWLAVRPEKMRIRRAAAGEGAGTNRIVGTVRDIAYYGDFFMFVVALPEGRSVRVSRPNLARLTELPITWDDRVAVEWDPFATVVLPE